MKKIIFLIAAIALMPTAKSQTTTFTLTPYTHSCAITLSNGQTNDYPLNSIYPIFTRDSTRVQFWNVSSGDRVMSVADSISHFYTGSFNFTTVRQLDSFFHCCMTK